MNGEIAARGGTLLLVPNALDFGSTEPGSLDEALPAAVIRRAAALTHWLVEDAKSARAFIKRVGQATPLAVALQEMTIRELPRAPARSAKNPAQDDELAALLRPALDGHDIGLLSEAGLPGVADPGAALVAQAHSMGLRVQPLPGASALLLALAASGLNGQQFAFVGYLPVKDDERAARIRELETWSRHHAQTQIAIETPYRNTALLRALLQHLAPATRLSVACAIGWPEGWCRTQCVSQWRATNPPIDNRLPAVFLFQGG